jgi:hypothetical protein
VREKKYKNLFHKLNKLDNNSIIKSEYFIFTNIIYTFENKSPNKFIIVG